MTEKLISPIRHPSAAALQLTIELIRAGKIANGSDAVNSIFEIRNLLEEGKKKLTFYKDKD
ncbi:hypothetical protein KTK71_003169 [Salmonella enterica]|nr:hypothetical protein [Salmonella enterica]ECT1021811.1 hypothetical protein [Salmonella enterica]EEB5699202.1 hypothetical protein [Salmonella enterica]EEF6841137.1 hypothetical protein [Salmonella enterica]EGX5147241.1 hypothetical protein [Salmonella enterica]